MYLYFLKPPFTSHSHWPGFRPQLFLLRVPSCFLFKSTARTQSVSGYKVGIVYCFLCSPFTYDVTKNTVLNQLYLKRQGETFPIPISSVMTGMLHRCLL